MSADDSEQLLSDALAGVSGPWNAADYWFEPVAEGTMATIWRGVSPSSQSPDVAVRLTPKPVSLISRIAELVDGVAGVECPQTLAVGTVETGTGPQTVHVCTWIGKGGADRRDPYGLGQDLARLHSELARPDAGDFTDRRLTFEPGPVPSPDQELPHWYVAQHLWRDRILPCLAEDLVSLRPQPIHGDLHWDNVVAGSGGGFGFIDFDKVMYAPPVFDLAKLLATGFFVLQGEQARYQQSRAVDLLAGYRSIRPLDEAEMAAIEGFVVILNGEIARLGYAYDVPAYQAQANALGAWWTARRRQRPQDPLGLRERNDTLAPQRLSLPDHDN
ncbi:phosphotransferase enzyme family protein [Streptomyces sp. NBC_01006]|uniref:phosphotransferase enzyme family protein n=1 Tax=Streptomyces sp. NBC_01006 TaxID=2903716 RepID=UPI00386D8549|nr:phosphotransferase [Streptomyces sp. NBC_01006]